MRRYAIAVLAVTFFGSAGTAGAECDGTTSPPVSLTAIKLSIKGFATFAVDDSFRLAGILSPVMTFDPVSTGLSLELGNEFSGAFAVADVPGGPGWRPRARGGASFSDPVGTHGGITRIKLKPLPDGSFAFAIGGRRHPYAASPDIRPIRVTVGLGTSACGEAYLSPSLCTFPPSGNALRCVPPPRPRRCGLGIDAQVRCDALNAAAAQEAYYVVHGRYLGGDCAQLPEFVPSPDVLCLTTGTLVAFALTTVSLLGTIACVYESLPAAGESSLVCS